MSRRSARATVTDTRCERALVFLPHEARGSTASTAHSSAHAARAPDGVWGWGPGSAIRGMAFGSRTDPYDRSGRSTSVHQRAPATKQSSAERLVSGRSRPHAEHLPPSAALVKGLWPGYDAIGLRAPNPRE